jgi:hypothetical protein
MRVVARRSGLEDLEGCPFSAMFAERPAKGSSPAATRPVCDRLFKPSPNALRAHTDGPT